MHLMQDAFDHPSRRRRRRSPTGAAQATIGRFSRWKATCGGKDNAPAARLAMLEDERTMKGGRFF